jgi:crossover junction endodeoxyribonuclease RuvC
MLILGIDPGTATTGYGLLEHTETSTKAIEFGLIETSKDLGLAIRLFEIHRQMTELLTRLNPDMLAIEKIFFATNAKTAINVGQAQGVMFLAAAAHNIPVSEYAPGTIKKMITGDGRADKKMVQRSIRQQLGNHIKSKAHKKTHFDNAADALAVALCHVFTTAAVVV